MPNALKIQAETKADRKAKQVNVALDGEVRRMFDWLKKYDKQFANNDSRTAMYLMSLGVEALKAKAAEEYEPLEAEVVEGLSTSGIAAMKSAVE